LPALKIEKYFPATEQKGRVVPISFMPPQGADAFIDFGRSAPASNSLIDDGTSPRPTLIPPQPH
jgi:hypothetical protein